MRAPASRRRAESGSRALRRRTVTIDRTPVLTLWASVVARRLGFARDEALTLGRAVAGLGAYRKGAPIRLVTATRAAIKERRRELKAGKRVQVDLLRRAGPVVRTREGARARSRARTIRGDGAGE